MGLDISLLETFRLVADLGSFSEAARWLGLSQPAVSFQIKSLERELAAPLIDRSGGKVVLTPAGRTAYRHARKLLSCRDEMLADIPRATGDVAGHLLIGAGTIPGEYLLPPVIREFRTEYPRVTVSLDISNSREIVEKLKRENIEIGFVGSPPEDPRLSERAFSEDRLVLITPPHHPLTSEGEATLQAIASEPFVNRRAGSGTRENVESALLARGIDPDELDVVAEMGSTRAVISAVISGMGVSIVSSRAAEHPAESGLIAMRPIDGAGLTREFFAVWSEDRPLSVAAEKFLERCLP
ncbi:MAG: LysR family transcriptional regulator [Actinobacteria bacterium]|nr:LysR family transcriptional regulator [Actinomycetota bacterium]